MFTCWIAKELGYPFRVYNVVCSSSGGHVRPAIVDMDDSDSGWMSTDPAAINDRNERRYDCLYDVWCDTDNGSTIVDTSEKNQLLGWMHW
ncbi:MAG: hypothetical protein LBD03_02990 [Methanobrevibacter sp.]|nr:hypothetical protein [Candidatus Methanovirga procula]